MYRHWTHHTATLVIAILIAYATMYSGTTQAATNQKESAATVPATGGTSVTGIGAQSTTNTKAPANQAAKCKGMDNEIVNSQGKTICKPQDKCINPKDDATRKECEKDTGQCGVVTAPFNGETITCPKKNAKKDTTKIPTTDKTETKCKETPDSLSGKCAAYFNSPAGQNPVYAYEQVADAGTGTKTDGSASAPPVDKGATSNYQAPSSGYSDPNIQNANYSGSSANTGNYSNTTGSSYSGLRDLSGSSYSGSSGSLYEQTSYPSQSYSSPSSYSFSGINSSQGELQDTSGGYSNWSSGYSPQTVAYNSNSTFSGDTYQPQTFESSQSYTEMQANSAMPITQAQPFSTQPVGNAFTPATPLKASWTSDTPAPMTEMFTEDGKSFKLNESFLAEAEAQEKLRQEQMKKIVAANKLSANPTAETGDDTWTALSSNPELGSKVTVKIKTKSGEQSIEVDNVVWYDAVAQRKSGRDVTLKTSENRQSEKDVTIETQGASQGRISSDLPTELFDNSYLSTTGGNLDQSFFAAAEDSVFTRRQTNEDQFSQNQDSATSSQHMEASSSSAARVVQRSDSPAPAPAYQGSVRYPQPGVLTGTGNVLGATWHGFVKAVKVVQNAWWWVLAMMGLH